MSVPPDYRILQTMLDQSLPEESPMPRRAFEITAFERTSDPGLSSGDVVTIEAGNPVRRERER